MPMRSGGIEESWKGQSDVRHRQPDQSILEHERKRKIEVACLELEDKLEGQGVAEEEIERQVAELREKLQHTQSAARGRGDIKAHETHELAAIKEKEMEKISRAFGINQSSFKEGRGFDREAQAQRAATEKAEREERRAAMDEMRANRLMLDQAAERRKQESLDRIAARTSEREQDEPARRRRADMSPRRRSDDEDHVRRPASPDMPLRHGGRRRSQSRSPPRRSRGRTRSRSPPARGDDRSYRRYDSRSRSPPPRRRFEDSPPRRRFEDSPPRRPVKREGSAGSNMSVSDDD